MRNGPLSLEKMLTILVGLLCLILVGATAGGAAWFSRAQTQRMVQQDMVELARNLASVLDREMFERFREIRFTAAAPLLRPVWLSSPTEVGRILDTRQASLPDYAWIGFVTPDGIVRASTKHVLENVSVESRPWFRLAMERPTAQDVHEAKLLVPYLGQSPTGGPLRFVDVAAPIKGDEGELIGVLGAHLSWDWARETRDRLLASNGSNDTELWILSSEGNVLLGPEFGSKPFTPVELEQMRSTWKGSFSDSRAGAEILTGYAVSLGYRDYPGLNWIVVARRPAATALATVNNLIWTIVVLGSALAGLGILLAWAVAHRIAAPIRRLTTAANRIGRDPNITMLPRLGGSQEVLQLSGALRSLLRRIGILEQQAHAAAEETQQSAARFTREMAELRQIADTDPLSGLLNRRAFLSAAGDAMTYYKRYKRTIAVLLVDIDFFKRVNDTYGHAAGDLVIQEVGALLMKAVRSTDKVARFGGEEFIVLLREIDEDGIAMLAERIRTSIRESSFPWNIGAITVTVSVGAAPVSADDRDIQDLIERADHALYEAKNEGRDRVVIWRGEAPDHTRRAA